MTVEVRLADLTNTSDAEAIVSLTDAYAKDPMGGGKPLPEDVKERLIPSMKAHPGCLPFLAFCNGVAVGIANCFLTFSSFRAAPILNVHDLAVLPESRGTGVSRHLMNAVESKARELGCAYISLEASVENTHARGVYAKMGFMGTELDESATLFCRKAL